MKGKITSIEVQKNNKSRVNVYIDSEYAFSCDMELVYKHKISVGSEVETKQIEEIAEADNLIKAKNDALRIIERSYKTASELSKRLLKKGYSSKTVEKVAEFMKEYSFTDDEKYTSMYIKDKMISQGRNKILFDLRKKGIDEGLLNEKVEAINTEVEEETALKLAEKKLSLLKKREADNRKLYQKLSQYLVSRGYSWDLIRRVLRKVLKVELEE